jgi:hypothetical protein
MSGFYLPTLKDVPSIVDMKLEIEEGRRIQTARLRLVCCQGGDVVGVLMSGPSFDWHL